MASNVAFRDGSLDFSGGVNSIAVPTVAGNGNPNGLQRSELAWLLNGSLRDGGISPRGGWLQRCTILSVLANEFTTYFLKYVNPWNIPPIGSSVILELEEPYLGSNGDQGFLFEATSPDTFEVVGMFQIVSGAGTTTITLKTLQSDFVGLLVTNTASGGGFSVQILGPPLTDYLFQGMFMYSPFGDNPYLIMAISGRILKVDVENCVVNDLSAIFGEFHPADQPYFFFEQAEQFLVIQAGDGLTLPLFWDGATLRRSKGITNPLVAPGTPGVNEIPAATAMCYYMGRLWYAQNRTVSASDIVGGASGTPAYNLRDSVLNITENPLATGGDGFTVPSNDGTVIRGIEYSASIDAALGQGRLFIGTRKAIYSLQVPVTRTDWIAADNDNQPLMTVVQLTNGWVNDRSIVSCNGDLFYQSLEPGIRSLQQSVRNFTQWGMVDLSANEQRILQFADRSLLRFSSGIFFQNRLLETTLPRQTPQGVVHDQIIPLDVVPISSFNQQRQPNWEGSYQAMPVFQMTVADFGGRERAFAAVRSEIDGSIQLWEITRESRVDFKTDPETDGNRIVFQFETPAFNWSESIGALELKKLVGGELWVDRLFGTVQFTAEYRPDGATCWLSWHTWKDCSPQNTTETVELPVAYPISLGPCYKSNMALPIPDPTCAPCNTGRPANIAFQFQFRFTIRGFCRVRGFWAWSERVERGTYQQLVC